MGKVGQLGFEKCKKWTKVDTCFSFDKPTKWYLLRVLSWLWTISCAEKSEYVNIAYLAKITANVQKNLKFASFGADFLYDEIIDYTKKKKLKIAIAQFTIG